MVKVKRALISVSDKTVIVDLAQALKEFKVEIISTGGTARLLKESGIDAIEISDYTGFPEMMDGRVKTLHPKVHGGLLSLRDNQDHMNQAKKHGIGLIDMVVVNLYPFEKTIANPDVQLHEAIENIDIGGPSMLRSAAKNYQSVAVVSDPQDYSNIINELRETQGCIKDETLKELGIKVFKLTSGYDDAIYNFLSKKELQEKEAIGFSKSINLEFDKVQDLRYGENSHQKAAFYKFKGVPYALAAAKQLHGKELSYNNILDLNTAYEVPRDFSDPTAVFIKHTNPCGVASSSTLAQACSDAWKCDSLSAFGGIVGTNRKIDAETAKILADCGFLECILAPGYESEALEILKQKKNIRLMELAKDDINETVNFTKVAGGLLMQDKDNNFASEEELKIATKRKPAIDEMKSLLFGDKVCKHVKSNAIVLTRGTRTVGIGAGQMSRVDSTIISIRKAAGQAKGSCLASDAFFPKADAIQTAADAGITAIIQPGGSISDEEIIKEADKAGIAMVLTGIRHFKH